MAARILSFLLAINSLAAAASTGKIVGEVKDAETGEPLPGANIIIQGTALGAASSLEGEYFIPRVPPGTYTLVASFIGYRKVETTVQVTVDETVRRDFSLEFETLEGETVVVTALLQGQAEAINKQLSSNTIVNVVSSDRIQELPDQNAAESLGRLPGISIQRDAGEGQKVIVRGLSPKFNSITVNGERIPSTDAADRSVDLSMISPDLISGIEVFKALTPDKDGDAVGGTVNFVLKTARPGRRVNTRVQYGYNDHQEELGQYKGTVSASDRLLNSKLGYVVTGSVQSANRSSDLLDASYIFKREQRGEEERALVQVNNLNLADRIEDRDRFGASVTLDYDIGEDEVVFSSFWSRTQREELRRRKRYRVEAGRVEYDIRDRDINTTLLTNSLTGRHELGDLGIDWRTSFSRSKQETPFLHYSRFRELAAFHGDLIDDQGPELIPQGAKNNLDETFFKEDNFETTEVTDRNVTAQVDLNAPFSLGSGLAGVVKFGGKVRDKQRDRENTRFWTSFFGINDLGAASTDGTFELTDERKVAISNFISPNQSVGDFLNGSFEFGPVLDVNLVNAFGRSFRDYQFSDGSALYVRDPLIDLEDYTAGEQIYAGYLMAQVNFWQTFMLLPGFRLERTENNYNSIFGDPSTNEDGEIVGVLQDTTGGQNYSELLPMVHLRVKPTSWFDVRLAATRTLSRPDYFNLVPWQRINRTERTIEQGNPNLVHTKVWNYDAYFSFYNKLGLFTVGAFYKEVDDIDYIRTTRIEGGELNGFELTEPINAEVTSKVKGIEFEIQTNFKYLPSPFDGVVLYANYSLIDSETFFPFFEIGPRSPDPPFRPIVIDTVRAGRMPGQSDDIANLSLGYEKAGFTGRISMIFQGEMLEVVGSRSELDGFSDSFVRWDIALQQKLMRGSSIFLNINNVTDRSESAFLGIKAFATEREFFGWTADVGFRYQF